MKPKPKRSRGGRPSNYRAEYAERAYQFCLLGATDADLARFFGVTVNTIDNWKKAHPEFLGSLKRGKEEADAKVADSLFRRALGYKHRAVKIFNAMGHPLVVPYTEHYPPDTTAAIFWLKNRRPDLWRDKQSHEHYDFDPEDFSDEGLQRIEKGEDPVHVLVTGGRRARDV